MNSVPTDIRLELFGGPLDGERVTLPIIQNQRFAVGCTHRPHGTARFWEFSARPDAIKVVSYQHVGGGRANYVPQ